MALNYTPQKIKSLIERSKSAEHYPESTFDVLDETLDGNRVLATTPQRLLDAYFKQHPEDKIENYMD